MLKTMHRSCDFLASLRGAGLRKCKSSTQEECTALHKSSGKKKKKKAV